MILFAKRIVGAILVFVGIAGVFLPLMPGVIFIILGSALLGSNHRLVAKVKSMAHERLFRGKYKRPPTEEAKAQKTMSVQISKVAETS